MPITQTVYEHLLHACSQTGDVTKSTDLINEMIQSNIPLSEICCISLINTLSKQIKKVKNKEKRNSIFL